MMVHTENPPLMHQKVEPKTRADQDRLLATLAEIAAVDNDFSFSVDPESGEIILGGQGELHLDLKIDNLIRIPGIGLAVGAPQVAYRETIARASEVDYTHKKMSGGTHQFARVKLNLEPLPLDSGVKFNSAFLDAPEIAAFARGVEKGVRSVFVNGVLIGFPMTDMSVTWSDGSIEPNSSTPVAFEIATRAAMKEGCEKAGIQILEPIMAVTTKTPCECTGTVLRNFDSRRGEIIGQEINGLNTVIRAHVPLANMFGYISDLRRLTAGLGTYEMHYSHYAPLPHNTNSGPDDFPPAIGMRA